MQPSKLEQDERLLHTIEANLEQKCYNGDQLAIFDGLAEKIAPLVQLSELEVRAFFLAAINSWEEKAGLRFGDMRKVDPPKKVVVVTRVFEFLKKSLLDMVKDPSQKAQFETKLRDILQFYIDHYSKRPIKY